MATAPNRGTTPVIIQNRTALESIAGLKKATTGGTVAFGGLPTNAETITITTSTDTEVYTFLDTLTGADNEVLIVAVDRDATMANLVIAINVNAPSLTGGDGQIVTDPKVGVTATLVVVGGGDNDTLTLASSVSGTASNTTLAEASGAITVVSLTGGVDMGKTDIAITDVSLIGDVDVGNIHVLQTSDDTKINPGTQELQTTLNTLLAVGTGVMTSAQAVTIATDDTQFGTVAEAASSTGAVHAQLRKIDDSLGGIGAFPSLGQAVSASSLPVVLASNGPFTTSYGSVGVVASATGVIHAQLRVIAEGVDALPTALGAQTAAASMPVTLASDGVFNTVFTGTSGHLYSSGGSLSLADLNYSSSGGAGVADMLYSTNASQKGVELLYSSSGSASIADLNYSSSKSASIAEVNSDILEAVASGLPGALMSDAVGADAYATLTNGTSPARETHYVHVAVGDNGAIISLDGGTTDMFAIPANTERLFEGLALTSSSTIQAKNLNAGNNYTNLYISIW